MSDPNENPPRYQESYRQQQNQPHSPRIGQQSPQHPPQQSPQRPSQQPPQQPPQQLPQQPAQQPPQHSANQPPQQFAQHPPQQFTQQPPQQPSQQIQSPHQSNQLAQTSPQQPSQQSPQSMSGQQMQPPQSMGSTDNPGSPTGAQSLQQASGRPQLRSVTVEEIVQTDVVIVDPDAPVSTAVERMNSEDVGCVVVVDDEHKPLDVVTDRTVALALEGTPDIAEREVSELLDEEIITGSTDMNVFDAIDQLNENSIRRLPIVDDGGTLEGIVTLDDLLVALTTELGTATEIIKSQSPRL